MQFFAVVDNTKLFIITSLNSLEEYLVPATNIKVIIQSTTIVLAAMSFFNKKNTPAKTKDAKTVVLKIVTIELRSKCLKIFLYKPKVAKK